MSRACVFMGRIHTGLVTKLHRPAMRGDHLRTEGHLGRTVGFTKPTVNVELLLPFEGWMMHLEAIIMPVQFVPEMPFRCSAAAS